MIIRRILVVVAFLCLIGNAHAQTGSVKTPSQLNTEINTLYPDNNTGVITPYNLRQVTLDQVASYAPFGRNINTTTPLGGGGNLSADLTLTCTGCAVISTIQTWTGAQSYSDGTLILLGAISGFSTLKAPATGGGTATLFPGTDTIAGLAAAQTLTNKILNCANNTCAVRIGSDVTGLGTGVAAALGNSLNATGGLVGYSGALGTPTSGVGTNLTGIAAGLTAGTVTTNANLTGDVTSVGNATTLGNAPVIAKVLTGFTSGAGTVTAADSILSALQKINGNVALDAPLASPAFTGTPTAPTAALNTNTTQIATQAAIMQQAATATPLINGTAAVGTSLTYARADHVHPTDTSRAPIASPALTGTPTAPTASPATNSTQIATTAYADAIATLKANIASPTFTGTPAAPTAVNGTNTTQLATTQFVQNAVAASGGGNVTGPSSSVSGNLSSFNGTTGILIQDSGITTASITNLFTAWTAYTPTLTSDSGTITSYSCTGGYKQMGKTTFFRISCSITTNGTGAGGLSTSLPFTANASQGFGGREIAVSGVGLTGHVVSGTSTLLFRTSANAYPPSPSTYVFAGVYETQ